jgi:hypothetical protein
MAPTPEPSMRARKGEEIPVRKNHAGSSVISGNAITCCQTVAGSALISMAVFTANVDFGTRSPSTAASIGRHPRHHIMPRDSRRGRSVSIAIERPITAPIHPTGNRIGTAMMMQMAPSIPTSRNAQQQRNIISVDCTIVAINDRRTGRLNRKALTAPATSGVPKNNAEP